MRHSEGNKYLPTFKPYLRFQLSRIRWHWHSISEADPDRVPPAERGSGATRAFVLGSVQPGLSFATEQPRSLDIGSSRSCPVKIDFPVSAWALQRLRCRA